MLISFFRFLFNITKKFFYIFQNYLRNSSVHGYHYLADEGLHWTERIFWLFFIIISSMVGVYMMMKSTKESTDEPISLTVNTLYLDWETKFPAVVFCEGFQKLDERDFVPYVGMKLEDFPEGELFGISTVVSQIIYFFDRIDSKVLECQKPSYSKANCILKQNFSQAAVDLRFSCKQIFNRCAYMGQEFNCCDRFHTIYTVLGKCFALNSVASQPPTKDPFKFRYQDSPILTIEPKITHLVAYVLTSEDVVSFRETNYGRILGEATNKDVGKGDIEAFIKVQHMHNDERVRNIPIEIRKCRFPDENNLKYSKVYSYPACIINSIAKLQLEVCGCVQHFLPGALSYPEVCKNLTELLCVMGTMDTFITNGTMLSKCDISCTESEVEVKGFLQSSATHVNGSVGKINIIVSPPTLRYERRVVRDYVYLIVNVGGIGTLFFGASVLSIVEIFYYFFIFPCTKTKVETEVEDRKVTTPIVEVLSNSKYAKDELVIFRKGLFRKSPFPFVK